ncbi:hypothetical protein EV356DRAFT_69706 [Viridothelium virens]|uniref:Uncharacterized protein n=1 Tax=Viridothelium virens TaxID=1048519 RepID=A0A6A6HE39_VIRVR|nr:hypothetical protein EV356DRAFT_69706 [Viridothelium virens]
MPSLSGTQPWIAVAWLRPILAGTQIGLKLRAKSPQTQTRANILAHSHKGSFASCCQQRGVEKGSRSFHLSRQTQHNLASAWPSVPGLTRASRERGAENETDISCPCCCCCLSPKLVVPSALFPFLHRCPPGTFRLLRSLPRHHNDCHHHRHPPSGHQRAACVRTHLLHPRTTTTAAASRCPACSHKPGRTLSISRCIFSLSPVGSTLVLSAAGPAATIAQDCISRHLCP